jgi:hypothetical protein
MKLFALTKLEKNFAVAEVEKALAANPQAAAEFDAAAGGRHKRRAEIENCLALLSARGDYHAQVSELKSKVSAAKARVVALQKAKDLNRKLRTNLTTAKSKLAKQPTATNRFAGADDALVMQAAVHRSSPDADKSEAKAELAKRGYTVSADNIVSKSHRKN